VKERVNSKGQIIGPLEQAEIDRVCREVEHGQFEALAVCLLFAYLNTEHERMLAAALRQRFPGIPISVSHEIAPIWREYERSSTVIADAFVKPLIQRYVSSLKTGLRNCGFTKPWSMMKSNGGLMDADAAALNPIQLAMSGPAGGAVASQRLSQLLALDNVVTIDVGGTSADVGVLLNGQITYTTEYEIEWGIPASIPLIDIKTIGAGGGSIAFINSGGFLQVGPQSAGSVPGPICYGHGGKNVTITDSNLHLRRLNPTYFNGGKLQLDESLIDTGLNDLASCLDMTPTQLALAVVDIANENMANAIRMVSIEKGHDPRHFSLLAFGGAGPLHGAAIAKKLGIPTVIVPPYPGGFCALGLLMGDLRVDKVWTQAFRSDRVQPHEVVARFDQIAEAAAAELRQQGFPGIPTFNYSIKMRYLGQNYEMDVVVPALRNESGVDAASQLDLAYAAFHAKHHSMYEYTMDDAVIEMVSFRVTAIGPIAPPQISNVAAVEGGTPTLRDVFFDADGAVPCMIIRRGSMPVNQRMTGPVIIEEEGSTTIVEPGMAVTRTGHDILILEVNS
jgi:N-methylhydantoinase A